MGLSILRRAIWSPCGHLTLVSEPASVQPRACEDFGCQIGGMLADPCPRPRKHLSSVSVIDLLERISTAHPQQFRVRHASELATHNPFLTAQLKM
jgi:hypothetical protein